MEKLNIKIAISNRLYPMHISAAEERLIRLSASKIEKMLKGLKERYSVKDDQDLLAMCALQLCVKNEKIQSSYLEENGKIIKSLIDFKKNIDDVI